MDFIYRAETELGVLFFIAAAVTFLRETHCRKLLELELKEARARARKR